MTKNTVDLTRYMEFVASITSNESNDFEFFVNRLHELQNSNVNLPLLLTAGIGLSSESGEFLEYLKKIVFQKKPLTEENKEKMISELGDCFWYLVNGCRALGVDPNDVVKENINKLIQRYPAGQFDEYYSENRNQ